MWAPLESKGLVSPLIAHTSNIAIGCSGCTPMGVICEVVLVSVVPFPKRYPTLRLNFSKRNLSPRTFFA